jgi:acyl carrier protein
MTATSNLHALSAADIRAQLAGFPEAAVLAVLALQQDWSPARLQTATLAILEFYLPRHARKSLADVPDGTRLREDLGVDSLALAEATFKLDELLGVPIETREAAHLKTTGELHAFLAAKLGFAA